MKFTPLHRLPRLACTALLTLCSVLCPAGWCAEKVTYLHALQAHNVLGPIELLASTGVSILNIKKLECSIYVDAKSQMVLVVSPLRKVYFKTPLNKFEYGLVNTLDTITDLELNPKLWKLKGQSKLCGQQVNDYQYSSTVNTYDHTMAYLPGKNGQIAVESIISTLQSPLATKPFCTLLKKMEHIPDVGGVPLRMETAYGKSRLRNQLSTVKITVEPLQEKTSPSLSGYRKAEKSSEVFFGHSMIDLLGN